MRHSWRIDSGKLLSALLVGVVLGVIGAPAGLQAAVSTRKILRTSKIFGTDDRQYVSNTKTFPWSATGLVEATFGTEIRTGTGAMVGNRTVLTCGHVVFDPKSQQGSKEIYFIPGKNGDQEPFGRCRVATLLTLEGWTHDADDNYDIALLILDNAVGPRTGYFQIAVEPETFFTDQLLFSAGYPGDLGDGQYQYYGLGRSTGMDGNMILHTLDSEPGQSGAPIWFGNMQNGTGRLVGVMKGILQTFEGVSVTESGIATRINTDFGAWIDRELAKYDNVTQGLAPVEYSNSTSGGGGNTIVPVGAPECGACGAGTDQALVVGGLSWGGLLAGKRRRRKLIDR
jgi:V8-like Glu-specific endopeptidase